jgi:hypothetical protein
VHVDWVGGCAGTGGDQVPDWVGGLVLGGVWLVGQGSTESGDRRADGDPGAGIVWEVLWESEGVWVVGVGGWMFEGLGDVWLGSCLHICVYGIHALESIASSSSPLE